MPEQPDFDEIVKARPHHAAAGGVLQDQTYELRQPLLSVGPPRTAAIRLRVDPHRRVHAAGPHRAPHARCGGALTIVVGALLISSLVAMLLAQWLLRPIHVIQSSLSRLGRGELDVRLDLPEQEFKDLGSSFEAVSAQLAAVGRGGQSERGHAARRRRRRLRVGDGEPRGRRGAVLPAGAK